MKAFYSKKHNPIIYFLYFMVISFSLFGERQVQKKVLICGVCRNVAPTMANTIANIEALGKHFVDYKVIIYENDSTDNTHALLSQWAKANSHLIFLSEKLPAELPIHRTEKIARARNIVLDSIRKSDYQDYEYLIMADLDFKNSWPISEIIKTIESPQQEWDCVSANGLAFWEVDCYYDVYAFRNEICPFGPEVMGDDWWHHLWDRKIEKEKWTPVYSAFGGLALYKTKSILNSSYSGIVTDDLKKYYKQILLSLPRSNSMLKAYLDLVQMSSKNDLTDVPITFRINKSPWEGPHLSQSVTVCEHLTLHASMALQGFGKFYVNPKMTLQY